MADSWSSRDGHRGMAEALSLRAVLGLDHTARAVTAFARETPRVAAFSSGLAESGQLGASWSRSISAAGRLDAGIAASRGLTRMAATSKGFVDDIAAAADSCVYRLQSGLRLDLSPVARFGRSVEEASIVASTRSPNDLWKRLEDCYPPNLRSLPSLDAVAEIARVEGIAVCGVPRAEIVQKLLAAPDASARRQVLVERSDEIMDDCRVVLDDLGGELVGLCSEAVEAFSDGYTSAAQALAAGVIESVALRLRTQSAKEFTGAYLDRVPIGRLRCWLALQPVARALVRWSPESGRPPPRGFSRHATVHAAGQPGVFSTCRSLTAVMLATSLAEQFHGVVADAVCQS